MSIIQHHMQSIQIDFIDTKFKNVLFRATFPIKRGGLPISQWYKKAKEAVASSEGIPIFMIKGKHTVIESKSQNRILFEWAGGVAIDMPDDATQYDYKILLHYLEGAKMALCPESQ